jgi:uncharacterized lipoprotein YmbA
MRLHPVVALLALLLAACGSSPKSYFYTLTAEAGEAAPAAGSPAIAVGPVSVPEMVDQPQIVARVDANQVEVEEYRRWASPLRSEIARVIAANLARELGTVRVWSYAQASLPNPDFQVLIDVQRFDSVLGEAVAIEALWTIRPAAGGAPRTGRSSVREPAPGASFDALAAAHSRALARVSRDIATAIRAK